MKLIKNIALLIAAIFVTRVFVSAFGLLLSVTPMIFELPVSEASRRVTYEILVAYFLVVTVILVITSISLFNQAAKRNGFQLNLVLTAISLLVYGAHLILGVVGDADKSLLVQFAQSFIWIPIIASFATLTSYLISLSKPNQ